MDRGLESDAVGETDQRFGLTWVLRRRFYEMRDSACSVVMGLAYAAAIALAAGIVLAAFHRIQQFSPVDIDWSASPGLILGVYVVVDLLFYWYHRTVHEVRIGWAVHVNHHSSEQLNAGTALRSSFVEAWIEPFFMIPALLIGIDPVMTVTLLSLNHLYQYWLHTRLLGQLGMVEWIMNTPSHHRVPFKPSRTRPSGHNRSGAISVRCAGWPFLDSLPRATRARVP